MGESIKFRVWKPEDNIELFIKIRNEAWRLNNLNPNLKKTNWNTWIKKDLKSVSQSDKNPS